MRWTSEEKPDAHGRTHPGITDGQTVAVTGGDDGQWAMVAGDWLALRTVEMIPATRRHIRDLAVRVAGDPRIGGDAELMASELLTNAVQHGSGEKIQVRVSAHHQAVRVEIRDAGQAPQHPATDTDLLRERGRGLLLVASLSRRWGLEHDGEGTTAWFEVHAETAQP